MADSPKGTRLLMANEPHAYRDVIAEAVRDLRPGIEVVMVEPTNLDGAIGDFKPDIVICSAATKTVKSEVRVWVELYPKLGAQSTVSIGGECSEIAGIQLSDLLSIVDSATQRIPNN